VDDLLTHSSLAKKRVIFINSINKGKEIAVWIRGNLPNLGRVFISDKEFEYNVDFFAGVTPSSTKDRIPEEFKKVNSYIRVLVATVAFVMGMNVDGLREIVVWDVGNEVTTLMQMIGRCRDGSRGRDLLLLPVDPSDSTLATEIANKCAREALVTKFCGTHKLGVEVTHDNCVGNKCVCSRCTCCSFCKRVCDCPSKLFCV